MKIAIVADHAGFVGNESNRQRLAARGCEEAGLGNLARGFRGCRAGRTAKQSAAPGAIELFREEFSE